MVVPLKRRERRGSLGPNALCDPIFKGCHLFFSMRMVFVDLVIYSLAERGSGSSTQDFQLGSFGLQSKAAGASLFLRWGSVPDQGQYPFASGGAALPNGWKLLFGEANATHATPARTGSQDKCKQMSLTTQIMQIS